MELEVRLATQDDVSSIVSLHEIAFPGYFLSNLGSEFLTIFYTEFLGRDDSKIIVALDGSRLTGFVVGTANANHSYSRFYRRHFFHLALIVIKRFITCPEVRSGINKRFCHLRMALRAILRKNGQAPQTDSGGKSQVPCRLLSIAVHPDYRGKGSAGKLGQCLMDQFKQQGVKRIGLSVHADNATAIKSYENNGWIVEKNSTSLIYFYHDII